MEQTFSDYVQSWDDLCGQIEKLKAQLKPLTTREGIMRKAIADRVKEALGDDWKEGVNNFTLPDMRVLKVTNKLKRDVVVSGKQLDELRAKFDAVNDRPCNFDDLLRTKHEVVISEFRKLEGTSALVFAAAITTKPSAPEVSL